MDAADLKSACAQYLTKNRRMAVAFEVGLCRRGRLRADVLGVNLRRNVVVIETKSGAADFRSDRKAHLYKDFCTQLYFAMDRLTYKKVKDEIQPGIGVMLVDPIPPGRRKYPIKVVRRAEHRELDIEVLLDLSLRLNYRSADKTRYKVKSGSIQT
jgi:hypothetical protein